MKKTLIALCACLLAVGATVAQETRTIPSKVAEATLFFNGAEVVHTATATLTRGENTLTIEGLSPSIDAGSLKIRTTGNVVVSSHEFSIDFLAEAKAASPRIKMLNDSIAWYQGEMQQNNIAGKTNQEILEYLKSGTEKNVSGSENGMGIDEMMKSIEYYQTKTLELRAEQSRLSKRAKELKAASDRLQAQLDQESVKGSKQSGVLRLTLSAPAAGNTTFTVSYFTAAAAWSPYYEVNIASTDKPIRFALRSQVRQTTGLDWDKVKLTLSTATPSNGKVAPLFNTWFLKPQVYFVSQAGGTLREAAQNSYAYEEEAQLDKVVAVGYAAAKRSQLTGAIATAPALPKPLYVINGVPATQEEFDALDRSMIQNVEVLKDAGSTGIYGSRAAGGVINVTTKSSMDDFVATAENELNQTFAIELPYSVPGNGKVQHIDLGSRESAAEYKYYCAPKLDVATYLLAEIADWQALGLLSAPARVTYDGTYIGETQIDASSTQPKLTLTLGTDKRIAVKREKMDDFSATRTLGSNTEQTFTYQVTVKNNQTRPVRMVTKEQYPRTTDKSIEVTLDTRQTTPWTANVEDLGVITWEEELAAGETKTYRISYTVKYPKGVRLNL